MRRWVYMLAGCVCVCVCTCCVCKYVCVFLEPAPWLPSWKACIHTCVQCLYTHTYTHTHNLSVTMYIHTHTYSYSCRTMWWPSWWGRIHIFKQYICVHTYTCIHMQDYVMAFMMGTHSRLGADSPVLLLDPLVAACIAQIIIADKWWVYVALTQTHTFVFRLYLECVTRLMNGECSVCLSSSLHPSCYIRTYIPWCIQRFETPVNAKLVLGIHIHVESCELAYAHTCTHVHLRMYLHLLCLVEANKHTYMHTCDVALSFDCCKCLTCASDWPQHQCRWSCV